MNEAWAKLLPLDSANFSLLTGSRYLARFHTYIGYAATKQSTIKAIALKTFPGGGCGRPYRKFAGCCALYKQSCCRRNSTEPP